MSRAKAHRRRAKQRMKYSKRAGKTIKLKTKKGMSVSTTSQSLKPLHKPSKHVGKTGRPVK